MFKAEPKADVKTEAKEKEEKKETIAEIKVGEGASLNLKSIEFLKGLLKELNIGAVVDAKHELGKIVISLHGENISDLIGYRGECLNSIQFLLNVVETKNHEECDRIVLDAEDYRAKREETLINLAKRMARKVAKTNHQVKLEPMNANERRIIHTALQNDTFVTTFSKGFEPNRFLIIVPNKDAPIGGNKELPIEDKVDTVVDDVDVSVDDKKE